MKGVAHHRIDQVRVAIFLTTRANPADRLFVWLVTRSLTLNEAADGRKTCDCTECAWLARSPSAPAGSSLTILLAAKPWFCGLLPISGGVCMKCDAHSIGRNYLRV